MLIYEAGTSKAADSDWAVLHVEPLSVDARVQIQPSDQTAECRTQEPAARVSGRDRELARPARLFLSRGASLTGCLRPYCKGSVSALSSLEMGLHSFAWLERDAHGGRSARRIPSLGMRLAGIDAVGECARG